jgi:hypothetical protein
MAGGTVAGMGAAASPRPVRAASTAMTFSRMVVVDEQRPGFEPDVKVAPNGTIFSSVPFGFSTTQSFVWSSRDHGNSYQFVPGNIGAGKPATCVGGGDTDLFVDPGNALYFSDLQGLTNISNSVSTDQGATWSTTCSGVTNSPDDRMWFAGTGSLAKNNLVLYQDFDQVASNSNPNDLAGNQLVETVSTNGTTFLPVVNSSGATTGCQGLAVNCVTDNEGISGNQVVDPGTGNVFIAHTSLNGNSAGSAAGVAVSEGKITLGTPTTGTWTDSPNLDASLCPDPSCVDSIGNPEELAGENFASIARDSAGYLYVAFTAGPVDHASSSDPNFGELSAPEQIYVVHSLQPATMTDPSKVTWSAPARVTGSGSSAGTNTFPWITAGSGGRVDVAYYHTGELSEQGTCGSGSGSCTNYGAARLTKAEWSVQVAQSLDAHAASPGYHAFPVSEGPVKHGPICTNGLGCTTGGDRSLGDFLQVTTDAQGAALVSYVFDTSGNHQGGEDTGPEVISRQIAGPGLLAGHTVTQNGGPGQDSNSVTDPTADADYSANGTRTQASPNLDLTGAALANGPDDEGPHGTLIATIKVKNLASLTASPAIGGPDASWMIRWTAVHPGQVGNGLIYYAGMDNNAAGTGTPTFFEGTTSCVPPGNPEEHCKYLTYPQTNPIKGSIDKATGVITLTIPTTLIGMHDGSQLTSVTAFTTTAATAQSATTLFNLIDSTPPFDFTVK